MRGARLRLKTQRKSPGLPDEIRKPSDLSLGKRVHRIPSAPGTAQHDAPDGNPVPSPGDSNFSSSTTNP